MITIILFLVFLTVGLAIWKGGEPFRWLGEGTVMIGESISRFGDFVDDIVRGSKAVRKTFDELKDTISDNEKD